MPARSAPKLPLNVVNGTLDSFTDSEIMELIKQNVKMVLLTNPGERIMIPEFGVGIITYLFELSTVGSYAILESRIEEQLRTYIPSISLTSLSVEPTNDDQRLNVFISYDIDILNTRDQLDLLLEY